MEGFALTKEQEWELATTSIDGTIQVDGFVFTMSNERTFMMIHKIPEERLGGIVNCSKKTLDEHIRFINENQVENLMVRAKDISFLRQCQCLKCISVSPPVALEKEFDFTPLYDMENLIAVRCGVEQDAGEVTAVDFTRMKRIRQINTYVGNFKGATGFQKIRDLEGIALGGYGKENLSEYFCSEKLKYMDLYECGLRTLDGIQREKELQWIELMTMRKLEDISALGEIADSVEAISIDQCSKIKDFSVLGRLENLRHLELRGRNILPNLQFLKNLKKLETFTFNMNVLDGDLTPCLSIPYVFCDRNRKHYNLKQKDLPRDDKSYWEWGFGLKRFPGRYI